jgi:hypothetical protein
MNKFRFTIKLLVIATFLLAFASIAQAQATRTWVSGVGDDVNPCSRTAPCKTFAGAISKTAKDGEISVLDPGGFGAVTITKSITINGTRGAGYGSIVASLVNGVIINITDVNDVRKTVRLVALDINGASTGINGIRILAASTVHVDDTKIDGFTGRGISDERTSTSPIPMLFVSNSDIRDNGIGIGGTGASAVLIRGIVENTRIQKNSTHGVLLQNGAVYSLRQCNISGNLSDGVRVEGANTQAVIVSSIMTNNQGIAANNVSGQALSLADVTIINNITGVGGTITTFGNNNVRNNAGGNALPASVGQQ